MVPLLEQVPPVLVNIAALVPVIEKKGLAKTSEALPVFETVTVALAVEPWLIVPKFTGLGEKEICGALVFCRGCG